MSAPSSNHLSFSLTLLTHLRERCEDFERRLRQGQRPRIEDFVAREVEPTRSQLLYELLRSELAFLHARESTFEVDDYLRRFPSDTPVVCKALEPYGPKDVEETVHHGPATVAGQPVVPGYELLRELGKGGMGTVYLARHVRLKRRVALKIITAGLQASEAVRARFQREAEAVARLHHPNIVQIFEVGEQLNGPFVALELVDGTSLDKRLVNERVLADRESARLVETIARAAHYAHENGVIHRDLKPGNVLLTAEGVPKITDFGLARLQDDLGDVTTTGAIVGTPAYMAPEQARGDSASIGPPTDVHALGTILYSCLTGKSPFAARSLQDVLHRVREKLPPSPQSVQKGTSKDLSTICMKCLRKEPRERYAGALELADDLQRFQRGEQVLARPVGSGERLRKWVRRNPVVSLTSFVAVGAIIVAFVVALIKNAELRRSNATVNSQNVELERKSTDIADKSKKLQVQLGTIERQKDAIARRLAKETFLRGEVNCTQGKVEEGVLWMARGLRECPDDARALEELIRLNLASWTSRLPKQQIFDRPQDSPVIVGRNGVGAVALSPDDRWVATAKPGIVELWHVASGHRIRSFSTREANGVGRLHFNSDGALLLRTGREGAQLWEVESGRDLTDRLPKKGDGIIKGTFSPQGAHLLARYKDGRLSILKVGEWQVVHSIAGKGMPERFPSQGLHLSGVTDAFLDERTFLHRDGHKALHVSSVGQTRPPVTIALPKPELGTGLTHVTLTLSADRKTLALATSKMIQAIRLPSGEPIGPALSHGTFTPSVAFHGNELLLTSLGKARFWNPATGQVRDCGIPIPRGISKAAISSDGRWIALYGAQMGGLEVRDFRTGRLTDTEIVPPRFDVPHLQWSARSPSLLLLARESLFHPLKAKMWTLDGATTPRSLPLAPEGDVIRRIRFCADGQSVLATHGPAGDLVTVCNVSSGKILLGAVQGPGTFREIGMSADGRLVAVDTASDSRERTVQVWDLDTGKVPCRISKRFGGSTHTALNAAGTKLIYTTTDATLPNFGRVVGWDVRAKRQTFEVKGTEKARLPTILSMWVNERQSHFLVHALDMGGSFLVLGEIESGRVLWRHQSRISTVSVVAFSPSGDLVGIAEPFLPPNVRVLQTGKRSVAGSVVRIRTNNGDELAAVPVDRTISLIRFHPKERVLLTANAEGTIRLLDFNGNNVASPMQHRGGVTDARFRADGAILLTTSADKTARLWDTRTGSPLGPAIEHSSPVVQGCFPKGSERALTISSNGELRETRIREPLEGSPAQIQTKVELWTRHRLDDADAVRALSDAEIIVRQERLAGAGN